MTDKGMTESWWTDAEHDPIHEAAAEWFARLQRADISAEDLLAWQRWLAADTRHAEAFGRLEEVCAMLRDVPRPVTEAPSIASRFAYDGTGAIGSWRARRSRRWLAVAASVVAIAATVLGVSRMWTSRDVSGAALEIAQTEVGQNRTVRLPDGSQVTLGGDTLLRASFNATSRHVELTRGEALFDVAKDRTRPFSVDTGTATVTAIGTQFNVRRREERVDIAVVDGAVVVEPLRQQTEGAEQFAHLPSHEAAAAGRRPQHEALRLMAGERAVVGSAGVRAGATFAAADAPIAWRSGRLVFEREPLREVVQDVNRYSRKPLALEDEGIGGLLFTGTVVNGNVEGWIASIQQVFSLDAVEQPDRIVLRRRAH